MEDEEKPSFWKTLPGVLTGIAGVLTALTGLFAVFTHGGQIDKSDPKPAIVHGVPDTLVSPPQITIQDAIAQLPTPHNMRHARLEGALNMLVPNPMRFAQAGQNAAAVRAHLTSLGHRTFPWHLQSATGGEGGSPRHVEGPEIEDDPIATFAADGYQSVRYYQIRAERGALVIYASDSPSMTGSSRVNSITYSNSDGTGLHVALPVLVLRDSIMFWDRPHH